MCPYNDVTVHIYVCLAAFPWTALAHSDPYIATAYNFQVDLNSRRFMFIEMASLRVHICMRICTRGGRDYSTCSCEHTWSYKAIRCGSTYKPTKRYIFPRICGTTPRLDNGSGREINIEATEITELEQNTAERKTPGKLESKHYSNRRWAAEPQMRNVRAT